MGYIPDLGFLPETHIWDISHAYFCKDGSTDLVSGQKILVNIPKAVPMRAVCQHDQRKFHWDIGSGTQ